MLDTKQIQIEIEGALRKRPTLSNWYWHPSYAQLCGDVINHPKLPDGLMTTSDVEYINEDETMCVTRNNIYNLVKKHE